MGTIHHLQQYEGLLQWGLNICRLTWPTPCKLAAYTIEKAEMADCYCLCRTRAVAEQLCELQHMCRFCRPRNSGAPSKHKRYGIVVVCEVNILRLYFLENSALLCGFFDAIHTSCPFSKCQLTCKTSFFHVKTAHAHTHKPAGASWPVLAYPVSCVQSLGLGASWTRLPPL